jgi:MFS family permease
VCCILSLLFHAEASCDRRAKWGGYIGATWGVANLVGPTVGGLITDRASWRWCFWFPLPIGVFASILLIFTLNLNPHGGESLRYHLTQFDALGLALIIGGVACALLGLTFSQTRGEMVLTIAMTVVGACLLLAAAIWEVFTKRSPIIPPRLFQVCDASSPL